MKQNFFLKTILVSIIPLFAQSQASDQSYTDCDGNTESIYGVISAGKPLIIASKGFDCSICMNQAPSIQTFADQNPGVRVWGAMNYRYSQATPECPENNNWRNTYSWDDIFMFNDVDDEWKGVSFPTYFVISPADSTIVYQGVQFSAATAAALPLVTSTGIRNEKQPVFEITVSNNSILARCVSANCESAKSLSLISLAGETIFNSPVQIASGLQATISLPENISPGIYLTVIYNENRVLHSKKTLIH